MPSSCALLAAAALTVTVLVTVRAVPPVGVKVNFTATLSLWLLALLSALLAAEDSASFTSRAPDWRTLSPVASATLTVLLPTFAVATTLSVPAPGSCTV